MKRRTSVLLWIGLITPKTHLCKIWGESRIPVLCGLLILVSESEMNFHKEMVIWIELKDSGWHRTTVDTTGPAGAGLNLGLFAYCAVTKSFPLSFRLFLDAVIVRSEQVNLYKGNHDRVKVDYSPVKSPLGH